MPNDIVRSFSGFFNRSRRDRKSGRQHKNVQSSSDASNTFVRSNPVEIRPPKPEVHFNDDYVDPLDMVSSKAHSPGRYDEPWEASKSTNNYDAPWGQEGSASHPIQSGLNYDEPWDAIGSTNGTISSETGKTSSSSGSSNRPRSVKNGDFRPDPRLIVDPYSSHTSSTTSHLTAHLVPSPDSLPHRRSRSLIPPPINTNISIPNTSKESQVRPAKSYESINRPTIPPTPGVLESPLKWQERNNGDISESQYLKQMLRQSPAVEAEDLLYGNRHKHRNVYDSPWSDQARPIVSETIPVQAPSHSEIITEKLYKLYDLNNSMSSQSTQSSSDHQHNQSVILLDQMDYYRAGMTRHEAEKILNGEEIGAFVVRRNTQNPSWFSLSVVTAEQGVLHLVISDSSDGTTRSDRPIGWHIGGFSPYSADFSSVPELINYYQANTLNIKGTKGLLLHSTTKR